MIKVIVAGGRDFENYHLLCRKLASWFKGISPEQIEIVSGGANGADKLGERFADDNGCGLKVFEAEWDLFGDSAGYIRNADMANYADACICFWDGKSKGTKHMIDLAKKKNLKLKVVLY